MVDTASIGAEFAQQPARRRVMALCAAATSDDLREALGSLAPASGPADLRPPETGLVMVQGRMGGDGAPFNIGEATVSRAAVRVGDHSGFAYHLGRDRERARLAATLDALWQDEAHRAAVEAALAPVEARLAEEAGVRAARTAATRVNFFTMVRGED
ncbi:MAG: phosphonate C-P lyase system protein PhnG [Pseudochelatococcus sp.]|jgi:alpha-D-ribose 1-methylphosphonate 5-triphosphate synthase subunit PhnG|uniref:phosphonate C-P lyase system protein PhnG n=1 Tax=Pseudochelatococcus sp. TaxID=2020869 RepID=UPI003D8D41D8